MSNWNKNNLLVNFSALQISQVDIS